MFQPKTAQTTATELNQIAWKMIRYWTGSIIWKQQSTCSPI